MVSTNDTWSLSAPSQRDTLGVHRSGVAAKLSSALTASSRGIGEKIMSAPFLWMALATSRLLSFWKISPKNPTSENGPQMSPGPLGEDPGLFRPVEMHSSSTRDPVVGPDGLKRTSENPGESSVQGSLSPRPLR